MISLPFFSVFSWTDQSNKSLVHLYTDTFENVAFSLSTTCKFVFSVTENEHFL